MLKFKYTDICALTAELINIYILMSLMKPALGNS